MKSSISWVLVVTIPFVSGGTVKHNVHAANVPAIQTVPTAAEHAETVEAVKITACVG